MNNQPNNQHESSAEPTVKWFAGLRNGHDDAGENTTNKGDINVQHQ